MERTDHPNKSIKEKKQVVRYASLLWEVDKIAKTRTLAAVCLSKEALVSLCRDIGLTERQISLLETERPNDADPYIEYKAQSVQINVLLP